MAKVRESDVIALVELAKATLREEMSLQAQELRSAVETEHEHQSRGWNGQIQINGELQRDVSAIHNDIEELADRIKGWGEGLHLRMRAFERKAEETPSDDDVKFTVNHGDVNMLRRALVAYMREIDCAGENASENDDTPAVSSWAREKEHAESFEKWLGDVQRRTTK